MARINQSHIDSAHSLVSIAQNRLRYTDLFRDIEAVVTARGAEPGDVGATRWHYRSGRAEGTVNAVFDMPAAIKKLSRLKFALHEFALAGLQASRFKQVLGVYRAMGAGGWYRRFAYAGGTECRAKGQF
ncbi:hypothetical protein ACLKMY_37720 [Paraburkholderia mimosarum]|uniref:hypothetical protein n=1 Tax=Paraburkholderia mimosarum TaxID=312026 RepID=UPI000407CC93|nr:hypothetical protein [Paraburkholderia mimosarum]